MLDRIVKQAEDRCPVCKGGVEHIIAGRISNFDGGQINVFQCDSCGRLSNRDLPRYVHQGQGAVSKER